MKTEKKQAEEKVIVDVTLEADHQSARAAGHRGNHPASEEEFRDCAVGMFIHWGLDSWQTSVISHWIIGADDRIVQKFYEETPQYFDPQNFCPDKIARLALQAGMKYGVFTAKHHSGFCMFHTESTALNVKHTPFQKDVTQMVCSAFREKGLKAGVYFSPLDFYFCRGQKKQLHFMTPDVIPKNNPPLMEYNKMQVRELMEHYGDIFCMFFDGPCDELRELVWDLQPGCLITRGEMKTPEQNLPVQEIEGAWEACFTLGDGWSYKATNEHYKTGTDLIEMLIEIRSRGGNLLLNVTPDQDGEIPKEQIRLLQELGLFLFFNGEAIYRVRPWRKASEGNLKFTKAKDENTVYMFVTGRAWKHGFYGREEVTVTCIKPSEKTTIEMVGQSGGVLEHKPEEDTKTKWYYDGEGLHISAMRCYRPYDNRQWPNPVVFRITEPIYVEDV